MRLSAKTRYGLAAMIKLAQSYSNSEYITLISLAERLKISKIYLEQVFSLLKRAELVISTKGAQGGYQLAHSPKHITVWDIFSAIETSLVEKTDITVADGDETIEEVMQEHVFKLLDDSIKATLNEITLEDLVNESNALSNNDNYMYYL